MNKKAFTLVELLVVISIIAILLAILMPALGAARSQGKAIVCKSNIRQLVLANTGYATENNGFYVPAASDMWISAGFLRGGYHRWHGVRKNGYEPFEPSKGLLVSYLADGKVKECPKRVKFVDDQTNYEKGCGGYGYNMTYIGSRIWSDSYTKYAYETTARDSKIGQPAQTLMFADCAISNYEQDLIEYSFAEPPFTVYKGQPITSFYMSPTIHFRHRDKANIGWVDGHISAKAMAKSDRENNWRVLSSEMNLGWFDPLDNSLFDLK
ncbi:MAG: prepilin-type N-terminal cleavage/methylation domain-containing protein [Anaerohalosphaeraceae bacterium]|nr:prepilin-type N-terminal cleavage/methylation domain-containing protein [Anaerohalosphaeraceae bacterium]